MITNSFSRESLVECPFMALTLFKKNWNRMRTTQPNRLIFGSFFFQKDSLSNYMRCVGGWVSEIRCSVFSGPPCSFGLYKELPENCDSEESNMNSAMVSTLASQIEIQVKILVRTVKSAENLWLATIQYLTEKIWGRALVSFYSPATLGLGSWARNLCRKLQ